MLFGLGHAQHLLDGDGPLDPAAAEMSSLASGGVLADLGGELAVRRLVKRFYELMDTLPEAYGIRSAPGTEPSPLTEIFSCAPCSRRPFVPLNAMV